ncbi:hypothetical protein [Ruegeria arenilitoris]|uniref:hypothetical protein n=1 Tax=Ruegeria arenilitoris TaxID=1173585 RepID=UPI00147BA522|nr:hypothetical protein [Ruegeria arenilitoris]
MGMFEKNLNNETRKALARKALQEIHMKKNDIKIYVLARGFVIGRFQYELRQKVKSTKLYGQELENQLPEIKQWDDALRSNNLWLYKALFVPGSDGNDILEVLEIKEPADFPSWNATVVKRAYKTRKKRLIAEGKLSKTKPFLVEVSQSQPDFRLLSLLSSS